MYGGYAWLTNQAPPVSTARRLLLIGGMVAFFVCALAIPHAFTETGLVFGLGYLLVILVHGGLYAQSHGRVVLRFVPFNVAGAVCVIVASQLTGTAVYALWVAPMALQYLASAMAAGVDESSRSGFDIRPAHFVERHGGLLIIALGESLAVIGIGVTDLTLNLSTLATAVLGLLLASALWWTYFATDADRAEAHLRDAPIKDRVRMALLGYFYAFLPMLLGITGLAAGLKLTISHVDAPLPLAPAFVLAGGVALYLLSNTIFRWTMHIQRSWYRVAAAIVALMTTALGTFVAGIVELVGLLATVVMMLVLEARYG